MVKNEFVDTYGNSLVVSGLAAKTRKVQQQPSNFSTRKTLEQVAPASLQTVLSFVVGILNGTPFDRYNITGLVLQVKEFVPLPKNPLSQVSKQVSAVVAFCCRTLIIAKISAIHLQDSVSVLLHIYNPPLLL